MSRETRNAMHRSAAFLIAAAIFAVLSGYLVYAVERVGKQSIPFRAFLSPGTGDTSERSEALRVLVKSANVSAQDRLAIENVLSMLTTQESTLRAQSLTSLHLESVRLGWDQIALRFSQGLLASATICLVASTWYLVVAGKGLWRIRQGKVGYDDMEDMLRTLVSAIETSAVHVLQEARRKEANVEQLESRVEELQALASLSEEQAAAVRKDLSPNAKLAIALGVLSIAVTIAIAIIQTVISF